MQVCTDLNAMNKDLVNKLKKESQQTLCLLTNSPDLTHDLFQLEVDKRELIKKKDAEHRAEVERLNGEINKLKKEFENYKEAKEKEIKGLNETIQQNEAEIEQKDKRIKDLQDEVGKLKDQVRKLTAELAAAEEKADQVEKHN